MEAAARVQSQPTSPTYNRRQPEKTALYQVLQQHLPTFEQQWTDEANGRTLPKFVTDELLEVVCAKCKSPLRLISLIKSEPIARKILVAMHLPADAPELHPARGPPEEHWASRDAEDYLN